MSGCSDDSLKSAVAENHNEEWAGLISSLENQTYKLFQDKAGVYLPRPVQCPAYQTAVIAQYDYLISAAPFADGAAALMDGLYDQNFEAICSAATRIVNYVVNKVLVEGKGVPSRSDGTSEICGAGVDLLPTMVGCYASASAFKAGKWMVQKDFYVAHFVFVVVPVANLKDVS